MLMSLIDQAQEVDAEWVEKERQEAKGMFALAQEVSAEESLGPSTGASDQNEDDSLITSMEDVSSLLSQFDQNEAAAAPDAEAAAAPGAQAAAAAVKTASRLGSQKSMFVKAAALRIGGGIKSYTADVVEAVSARRELALTAEETAVASAVPTEPVLEEPVAATSAHPEVVAAVPSSFALPFSFFSAFLTPSVRNDTSSPPATATGEEAPSPSMKAAEMFGLVDTDGSGTVSKEELAAHMNERGYSDEEIASAMSVLDVDGDGKVTLVEFTKGLESAEALRA